MDASDHHSGCTLRDLRSNRDGLAPVARACANPNLALDVGGGAVRTRFRIGGNRRKEGVRGGPAVGVREQGLVQPGDIGLIVAVGSGIQVGCATYYF